MEGKVCNSMTGKQIIAHLPYQEPFLFVDEVHKVDANSIEGSYTFKRDSDFYKGHFKNNPITPGVLLTECCAQIGLVCLGTFLGNHEGGFLSNPNVKIAMTRSEMDFFIPVLPGETVKVTSEKVYFRFHKLQCKVKMRNAQNKLVCKGVLEGMLKLGDDGN